MRRAQLPLGISKVSSREAKVTGAHAAQAAGPNTAVLTTSIHARGASATGQDADGLSVRNRLWFIASVAF
jgi:hypothetical protein